jgi:acetyl-CoA carboxylase biotin carboxyl carrier protein
MDLKELRRLLRLMRDYELSEIEIEEEALPELEGGRRRVRLRRGVDGTVVQAVTPAPAAPAAPTAPAAAPAADGAPVREPGLVEITSPMVGTFYRASSPEADAFVQVGDTVGPESVVCIIEAMKVMNEIKAEVQGEVLEILVTNAEAVEFGQPLFLVRPTGG